METKLFENDDLKELFEQINNSTEVEEEIADKEMDASQKRYMDIIKKHKNEE